MAYSFDATAVKARFGLYGQETALHMAEDVKTYLNCELIYDAVTKKFTILNSREISLENIQKVFQRSSKGYWKPEIEGFVDSEGNKIVNLVSN